MGRCCAWRAWWMMARPKAIIDVAKVERLAGQGLTLSEICTSIGISDQTLYRRKRQSLVLSEAIKRGRAKTADEVSNWLYELCKKKNLGAIIWYEKTRRGLSDRVDMNVHDWREDARRSGVEDVDSLFEQLVKAAMDRASQSGSVARSTAPTESSTDSNSTSQL